MRYNARANISPDEEFKQDIALIRKNAQQKCLSALIKFHYRRVERNKIKLHRIQQRKSNDENLAKNKAQSTVREPRTTVNKHEERIENIQKRMDELKQNKFRKNRIKCLNLIPMLHYCLQITLKGKGFQNASFIPRNATNGEKKT